MISTRGEGDTQANMRVRGVQQLSSVGTLCQPL